MIYQSKFNRHVTYESKSIGSFKYVQLFWKGERPLITTHSPVDSIRGAIAQAETVQRNATQYEDLKDVLFKTAMALNAKARGES